ncbi:MAG TPA: type II 3-dehydroquinate dehydratase [Oligoflexia bacterium]|nr:type II 3-dehydroquinate dehydratase [Oligoflexia bacterium]HMP49335.1 type II 3-dehydroquinate dehydratase [Oligoflexia bacterium]
MSCIPGSCILVLQGPNLNMLGAREPDKYGLKTLEEVHGDLKEYFSVKNKNNNVDICFFQSNSEAALIEKLHESIDNCVGLIINPAGLTHSSVSLRDAASMVSCPKVEVHISNIYKREHFRQHSYFHDVVDCIIAGAGTEGYLLGLDYLLKKIS